jgi:hypothetical protein
VCNANWVYTSQNSYYAIRLPTEFSYLDLKFVKETFVFASLLFVCETVILFILINVEAFLDVSKHLI